MRTAKAVIKQQLPYLLYQYLHDIERDRAWVSCSEILQHFSLGNRIRTAYSVMMRLYGTHSKRAPEPHQLPDIPVFVMQTRVREYSAPKRKVRVFLVERNHFYKPPLSRVNRSPNL